MDNTFKFFFLIILTLCSCDPSNSSMEPEVFVNNWILLPVGSEVTYEVIENSPDEEDHVLFETIKYNNEYDNREERDDVLGVRWVKTIFTKIDNAHPYLYARGNDLTGRIYIDKKLVSEVVSEDYFNMDVDLSILNLEIPESIIDHSYLIPQGTEIKYEAEMIEDSNSSGINYLSVLDYYDENGEIVRVQWDNTTTFWSKTINTNIDLSGMSLYGKANDDDVNVKLSIYVDGQLIKEKTEEEKSYLSYF